MSTDTHALFEVENAQTALDEIFNCVTNKAFPTFDLLEETFRLKWQPEKWAFHEENTLRSRSGLHLSVEGNRLEVYFCLRYWSFTRQEELGKIVKDAFDTIGRIVGAKRMLVHHELLPAHGDSLDEVAQNLIKTIGVPAKSFQELHEAEFFEEKCWMITEIS